MDTKKFGAFLSEVRKEKQMTQAELAAMLQVTDKAVSKWERGVGFPDINTLEPLAKALDVSVAELIQSERLPAEHVSLETASVAVNNAFDLMRQQRKQERRSIAKLILPLFFIGILVFLIDAITPIGFFMVVLPCICGLCGIILLVCGLWRRYNRLPCRQTLALAFLLLLIPITVQVFLVLGFILGLGPVPN